MAFSYTLKRLLSFVYPILIEKIPSQINGDIELSLQNGKLVVDSKLANYSYGSLHEVFQQIIKSFKFYPEQKKALILGFGAGSIATILLKEAQLDLAIDGVELDPVLLEIYKKHYALEGASCTLFQQDVIAYLETCSKQYDYIFIDVFVNLDVPASLQTKHFLDLLEKVSTTTTQIAMNTMLDREDDFPKDWFNRFGDKAKSKRYHSENLVLFKTS